MKISQDRAISLVKTREIGQLLILVSVATLLPFYIHLQWLTGPIINAILIIALFLIGIRSALVLCLIPSLIALGGGLLPAVLAPMVPFIMISNVIFVITTEWFYEKIKQTNKGFFIGVTTGAILKFVFLFSTINLITRLLLKSELSTRVAQILSWPQLFTALTGGMLAFVVLKRLKRL